MKASALEEEGTDTLSGIEAILKSTLLNVWFMAGLTCFGLALVAYKFVLGKGVKLSVAYPLMTTCGFAIVLLASRIFFHETLNPLQWFGIGLLVAGIWLIASQM